jgi:hypothetical protein
MLPFYRFRNNFVVAKKPLSLEPHTIGRLLKNTPL